MPFHVDDFITSPWVQGALRRQPELVAWYVMLLLHQWKHGSVPLDLEERADICGTDAERMRSHWPALQRRFKRTPQGWLNLRLEEVRREQEGVAASRKASAATAAKARWQRVADASRMPTHTERNADDMRHDANKKLEVDVTSGTTTNPPAGLNPVQQAPPLRKPPARQLPEDWQPNDGHRERAVAEGVDLWREAEKFRQQARATGRTLKNWDAGFTTWLMRAGEYTNGNGKHGGNGTEPRHTNGGHSGNGAAKATRAPARFGSNQGELIVEG
jgi:uncharacterized protein YdaU (DUF1376 family)